MGSRTQSNRLLTPYWRYERLRQPLLVATVRTCTKRSKSFEALTIDFESSALNRTQPPFRDKNITLNIQRPISNDRRKYDRQNPACEAASSFPSATDSAGRGGHGRQDCVSSPKNVTILGLPRVKRVLHLVYAHGRPRYYLLLTGIHRPLAPLFTSISNLFGTSTLPHRHDSTQTWNSAGFAK